MAHIFFIKQAVNFLKKDYIFFMKPQTIIRRRFYAYKWAPNSSIYDDEARWHMVNLEIYMKY